MSDSPQDTQDQEPRATLCNLENRGKKIGSGSYNVAYEHNTDSNLILVDRTYDNTVLIDDDIEQTLDQFRNIDTIKKSEPTVAPILNTSEFKNIEDLICSHDNQYHTIYTCPKMGMTFWTVITVLQQIDPKKYSVYIVILYILLVQMIRLLNKKNLVHGDPTLSNIMFGKDIQDRDILYSIENSYLFGWVTSQLSFSRPQDQYEKELRDLFENQQYKNDMMNLIEKLKIKWIDLDTLTRLENPTHYDRLIDIAIAYQSMFGQITSPEVRTLVADIMTIQMFSLNTKNPDEEWILYILGLGQFYEGYKELSFTSRTTKKQYLGYFRNDIYVDEDEEDEATLKEVEKFKTSRNRAKIEHSTLKTRRNINNHHTLLQKTFPSKPIPIMFQFKDDDEEDDNDVQGSKRKQNFTNVGPQTKKQKAEIETEKTRKSEWSSSSEDESDSLLANEYI